MKRFIQGLAFALGAVALVGVGMAAASAGQEVGMVRLPGNGPAPTAAGPTRAPGAIEPEAQGTVYVPITPCRLLDTRIGAPLTDGDRAFKVSGTLAPQGGSNTCGIPPAASAVSLNLTAISADGQPGFVRGWPTGAPPANATLINFAPSINASNAVEVPVCTGACASDLTLRSVGSAHLVGDAVGYHVPTMHARIGADGSVFSGSSRVESAVRTRAGRYVVTFDRDLTGCSATASIDGGPYDASATLVGDQAVVDTWQMTGGNPVAADLWFYLTVTC